MEKMVVKDSDEKDRYSIEEISTKERDPIQINLFLN